MRLISGLPLRDAEILKCHLREDSLFLGKLSNLSDAQRNFDKLKIYIRDASIYSVIEENILSY